MGVVGVVAVGEWNWDRGEGDMGDTAREGRSERELRNWRKGWLGWVVAGRRLSRRVADTVRHRSGSIVVRRRKADYGSKNN